MQTTSVVEHLALLLKRFSLQLLLLLALLLPFGVLLIVALVKALFWQPYSSCRLVSKQLLSHIKVIFLHYGCIELGVEDCIID